MCIKTEQLFIKDSGAEQKQTVVTILTTEINSTIGPFCRLFLELGELNLKAFRQIPF